MNNKGTVLLIVLLVIVVVATLGAIITNDSIQESQLATRLANSTRAFWMAEAGIQRAIWEVKHNDCQGMSNQDTHALCTSCIDCGTGNKIMFRTLATGEYEVTVDSNNSTVISGGYFPAKKGSNMYRVVKVNISNTNLFGYGAFAKGAMRLGNGVRTDSYDSTKGDYNVGGNKSKRGDIGTNGTVINIGDNSTVAGNVSTGSGGTIDAKNATITGTTTQNNNVSTPPVVVPTALTSLNYPSPNYLSVSGTTILMAGDYKYSRLSVISGATLKIDGSVRIYLTESNAANAALNIDNNATFNISSGGSLKLYTDGKIDIKSNAEVKNLTQDASKFVIYSTFTGGAGVAVGNRGDVYATIYSPETDVSIRNNTGFFGSMIGRTVNIGSGSFLHYDVNLKNFSSEGDIGIPRNWQEL